MFLNTQDRVDGLNFGERLLPGAQDGLKKRQKLSMVGQPRYPGSKSERCFLAKARSQKFWYTSLVF